MSLLRQDPSHYPTVCYWKQIWLPLEKSVGTGQAGCEVPQQYSPSLQQQDLPEMFTMSLYFIALDGILLQHFFQYMHHVRSNPQSFVRGICNIQFYKEQYDVLPTVPPAAGRCGAHFLSLGLVWITALSVLGLLFAFVPIFLSHQFPQPWLQNLPFQKLDLLCWKFWTWRHRLPLPKMCLRNALNAPKRDTPRREKDIR